MRIVLGHRAQEPSVNMALLETTGELNTLTKSCSPQDRWPGARVLTVEVVPMPGHGAKSFAGHKKKSMFRLQPVPENRPMAHNLNRA